jgi:hypothetical protein
MKNISELYNLESGKCVLIGGGYSVNGFDFNSLDSEIMRIAVNRCFVDTRIDYQIFTDPFFIEWIKKYPLEDARCLIGPRHLIYDRVDFYYDFGEHINEGFHTGYHALQIAELLGFEEIYLIGFDYNSNGKAHYYEGLYNTEITELEKKAVKSSFGKWLKDFNKREWKAKIYNCNPDSGLKKFTFKEV